MASAPTCSKCQSNLDQSNWSRWRREAKRNICEDCDASSKALHKRIARLKTKLETIQAYGGSCVHCGESHPFFLSLDHIQNNGFQEEKRGTNLYKELKKLGFPKEDLQLLCHNCNARKEYQDLRANGKIKRSLEIISRVKTSYSLSKEEEKALWDLAKELYSKIEKFKFKL